MCGHKMSDRTIPRISLLALLITFLTLAVFASPAFAQTKTFQWLNWDIDIVVNEDGSMRVTETQTLNFSGAPFTFGFRGIPIGSFGNNDGITDISVREGDQIYQKSTLNGYGTFEVLNEGNETVINWYFEPALGTHTYTFAYTVHGAIRTGTSDEGSGDQLFWTVIPSDHPATVGSSRITVTLPEGVYPQKYYDTGGYLVAAYLNDQQTNSLDITVSDDERVITFETRQAVAQGDKLDIRVQVPHGLLIASTPEWQTDEQLADAAGLAIISLSLFLLVAGPLAAIALWYVRGRDPKLGVVVPDYITEPPDNLPPAMVGSLVDERVDMQDIVSTLVDLAHRGYLTMEESKKKEYTFARTEKPDQDLRAYEQKFLKYVFSGKDSRTLASLQYKFASNIPNLRDMIFDNLISEGYLPSKPPSVHSRYLGLAIIVTLMGIGASILVSMLIPGGSSYFCFPIFAFIVTGIALLIMAKYMPRKTAKGAEAAAKWNAFKAYLKNIKQYTDIEKSGELFDKYLAYAIAFGLERSFINTFTQSPSATIPPWYTPYPPIYSTGGGLGRPRPAGTGGGAAGGGMPSLSDVSGGLTGGLAGMSAGLTRMLNNTSNVLRSTPPPASTGGGSRSGGGGWSSGGGFSGGSSGGFSGGSSGGGGRAGFG